MTTQLTAKFILDRIEQFLIEGDGGPNALIKGLMDGLDPEEYTKVIGGVLQNFQEQFTQGHLAHGDSPMQAMGEGAREAMLTLSIMLIAVGMKFRDAQNDEISEADVDGFLNGLGVGDGNDS